MSSCDSIKYLLIAQRIIVALITTTSIKKIVVEIVESVRTKS